MFLYKKIIKPKNTAAKISALLCLLSGLFLWIISPNIPYPAIPQSISVIFFAAAIYIASAYLLREYSYEIANNYKENCSDTRDMYDLIITEKKGNRNVKVCHIELSDVTAFTAVDPKNAKQIAKARKNKSRYTYNTQFAPNRKIEISAKVADEEISILLTYDEELLLSLKNIIKN